MLKSKAPLFITISGADEDRRELVARVLMDLLGRFELELDHLNANEAMIEHYNMYPDRQMLQKMYRHPVKIATSPGPKLKKGGRQSQNGVSHV